MKKKAKKKAAKKAGGRTKVVQITLARLVRQCAPVNVRVPADLDEDDLNRVAGEVYELAGDDVLTEWKPDLLWGCDEGTHNWSNAPRGAKAQYTAARDEDGYLSVAE